MEQNTVSAAIARVAAMERIFDILCAAAKQGTIAERPVLQALLGQLLRYYEGEQWRRDYALDEAGLLPATLKRGVLSEDGVYNALTELERQGGTDHDTVY